MQWMKNMESHKPVGRFFATSPFGDIVGVVSATGLLSLDLVSSLSEPIELPNIAAAEQEKYQQAITALFAGETPAWWPNLIPQGTAFQQRVWQGLLQIPKGEVWSYGQLAEFIGAPKGASRAVGTACGRNPIALFIPCHRIIRQNGELGGFGWGLPMKRHLLKNEGIKLVFREAQEEQQ